MQKTATIRFEPSLSYVHLRLIGKLLLDFLLLIIKFFFRYVSRLKRYKRISVESRRF